MVVLTTEHMRQVLALVIGKVSPEKTEEEVKMVVQKADWKIAVINTNCCGLRMRRKTKAAMTCQVFPLCQI